MKNEPTTKLEKGLFEIGETYNTWTELNAMILEWGQKRGWYILINRIPKKGWIVYGLQDGGNQTRHEIGLGILQDYFDKPVTMLNKFITA